MSSAKRTMEISTKLDWMSAEGGLSAWRTLDTSREDSRSNWTKRGNSAPSASICFCTRFDSCFPSFATPALLAVSTEIQSILLTSGTSNSLMISGGIGLSFSSCASSISFASLASPSDPSLATVAATRALSSFSIFSASAAEGWPMMVTE